jgi:hypothetical protein
VRLRSRDICRYVLGYRSGGLGACAGLWLLVELFDAIDTWLLLDSRVVDVPMAYHLTVVLLSSLKPFFFTRRQNALCFSVNAGA